MLPLLVPILTQLAGAGMQKVVDAVLDKGTQVVEEKLGVTLTPGPDGKLSEEKLASIKEAAMKHEEFMFEQEVKDRSSARQREVDIASNEHVPLINKVITPYLAIFVVAASFVLFSILIFVDVRPEAKDILIYILGVLSAAVTQILSYYFGSSIGSKDKSDLLALKK
jgi:hypothetical protein